jgi:hypothetical protein
MAGTALGAIKTAQGLLVDMADFLTLRMISEWPASSHPRFAGTAHQAADMREKFTVRYKHQRHGG